jgi:hypothetical protein
MGSSAVLIESAPSRLGVELFGRVSRPHRHRRPDRFLRVLHIEAGLP